MRTIAIIATLALLLTAMPTASALRELPLPSASVSYDVDPPNKGCLNCASADVGVAVLPPRGCMDCPAYFVGAGASNGPAGPDAYARVCQSAFFYICWVDASI